MVPDSACTNKTILVIQIYEKVWILVSINLFSPVLLAYYLQLEPIRVCSFGTLNSLMSLNILHGEQGKVKGFQLSCASSTVLASTVSKK